MILRARRTAHTASHYCHWPCGPSAHWQATERGRVATAPRDADRSATMWRLSFFQNGVALGPAPLPTETGGLIPGEFALRPAVSVRDARTSVAIRARLPPRVPTPPAASRS